MSDPVRIIIGDVRDGLRSLAAGSVQCCVTSPPYWGLRDYGVDGQIGLEATPERFVETMVEVFGEVRRVLRDDGTLWLNLGDSYASSGRSDRKESPGVGAKQEMPAPGRVLVWEPGGGHNYSWFIPTSSGRIKPKDLCMMPWRVAMALHADGWWLRSVICWHKRSPMPESVTDRPTSSWEPIFLMAKSDRYFYDAEAVKEKSTTENVRDGFRGGNGTRYTNGRSFDNDADAVTGGGSVQGDGTRNMRNVWSLSAEPYSEAHFATFPSEIPRRAIKAGTSEKGCCPACGTPWDRVVERTNMVFDPSGRDGRMPGNGPRSTSGTMVEPPSSRTVGWYPGCGCDGFASLPTYPNPPKKDAPASEHAAYEAECERIRLRIRAMVAAAVGTPVVPCVVLDPFLGSGTTIAAARQLERYGVGIELNPTYADMARVRIGKAEKPHTYRDHREPAEKGLFT